MTSVEFLSAVKVLVVAKIGEYDRRINKFNEAYNPANTESEESHESATLLNPESRINKKSDEAQFKSDTRNLKILEELNKLIEVAVRAKKNYQFFQYNQALKKLMFYIDNNNLGNLDGELTPPDAQKKNLTLNLSIYLDESNQGLSNLGASSYKENLIAVERKHRLQDLLDTGPAIARADHKKSTFGEVAKLATGISMQADDGKSHIKTTESAAQFDEMVKQLKARHLPQVSWFESLLRSVGLESVADKLYPPVSPEILKKLNDLSVLADKYRMRSAYLTNPGLIYKNYESQAMARSTADDNTKNVDEKINEEIRALMNDYMDVQYKAITLLDSFESDKDLTQMVAQELENSIQRVEENLHHSRHQNQQYTQSDAEYTQLMQTIENKQKEYDKESERLNAFDRTYQALHALYAKLPELNESHAKLDGELVELKRQYELLEVEARQLSKSADLPEKEGVNIKEDIRFGMIQLLTTLSDPEFAVIGLNSVNDLAANTENNKREEQQQEINFKSKLIDYLKKDMLKNNIDSLQLAELLNNKIKNFIENDLNSKIKSIKEKINLICEEIKKLDLPNGTQLPTPDSKIKDLLAISELRDYGATKESMRALAEKNSELEKQVHQTRAKIELLQTQVASLKHDIEERKIKIAETIVKQAPRSPQKTRMHAEQRAQIEKEASLNMLKRKYKDLLANKSVEKILEEYKEAKSNLARISALEMGENDRAFVAKQLQGGEENIKPVGTVELLNKKGKAFIAEMHEDRQLMQKVNTIYKQGDSLDEQITHMQARVTLIEGLQNATKNAQKAFGEKLRGLTPQQSSQYGYLALENQKVDGSLKTSIAQLLGHIDKFVTKPFEEICNKMLLNEEAQAEVEFKLTKAYDNEDTGDQLSRTSSLEEISLIGDGSSNAPGMKI